MTQQPLPLDYERPPAGSDRPWWVFMLGLVPLVGCGLIGGYDVTYGDPPGPTAYAAYHWGAGLIIAGAIAWLVAMYKLCRRRRLPMWTFVGALVWTFAIANAAMYFIDATKPARYYTPQP